MAAVILAMAAGRGWAAELAWMGIIVGPVPEPLATQLGLEAGLGLMVANVAVDSPADRAGLQRYDVLVGIDGQSVPGDVARFIETVRRHKAGDSIALTLYRQAKEQTVRVALAAMPEQRRFRYKHGPMERWPYPEGSALRGKVFRLGPQGWQIEDLDDWVQQLPEPIRPRLPRTWRERPWVAPRVLPQAPGPWGRRLGPEGPVARGARVAREGKVLEIDVHRDGTITVRRIVGEPDARTQMERTYGGPEALREGDAEAYEVYRQMEAGWSEAPGEPQRPLAERFQRELESALEDARQGLRGLGVDEGALNEYLQRIERRMRQLEQRIGQRAERLKERYLEPSEPPSEGARFEVHADGSIAATIRRGGDEAVLHFKDEQELKQREPKLYERLQALRAQP